MLLAWLILWTQVLKVGFTAAFEFHAYNRTISNRSEKDERCPKFEDATKPFSDEFIEKLKLWPGLMTDFDKEHGETLYGAEIALEAIWKSQNPDNCSTAKFLVFGGWPYGFGSRIHMEGVALGLAMHLKRVYLPHPDGDNFFWETFNEFCRTTNRWEPGMGCYYQPMSKCNWHDTGMDVNKIPNIEPGSFKGTFDDQTKWEAKMKELENVRAFNIIMTTGKIAYDNKIYIPHQLVQLISCSPMKPGLGYYWWRAVSATYIARPHDLAVQKMANLTQNIAHIRDTKECIAMHVRHGDKAIEMQLLPFSLYREVAEAMWRRGMVPAAAAMAQRGEAPSSKNGTFFLSSEDVAVFQQAIKWGAENGWDIQYTNLVHREGLTAALTYEEQLHQAKSQHEDLEYLSYIFNLQYGLQCEAYVCTIPSNTCRILDELRVTVAAKANRVYADISQSSCHNPPCFGAEGMYNFGE